MSSCYQVDSKSLEVTIWDYYPNKASTFLGEVLLDLYSANLQEELVWYPVGDHDENSAPLPPVSPKVVSRKTSGDNGVPVRKVSGSSSDHERSRNGVVVDTGDRQPWNSLPLLPATPAHDKFKQLLHKRNVPSRHTNNT